MGVWQSEPQPEPVTSARLIYFSWTFRKYVAEFEFVNEQVHLDHNFLQEKYDNF